MSIQCEPSRFLDEIPENLVEYHQPQTEVTQEQGHDILANMLKMLKG